MLNDAQYQDLLTRLTEFDMKQKQWAVSDVQALASSLGWRVVDDRLDTPNPLLGGRLVTAARPGADYLVIFVRIAEETDVETFNRYAAQTEKFFGREAAFLTGRGPDGNGPCLTWHSDHGVTYSVERADDRITLALRPVEQYEWEWSKSVDYGDGPFGDGDFPTWLLVARGACGWGEFGSLIEGEWAKAYMEPFTKAVADEVAALVVKTLDAFGATLPEFGMDDLPGALVHEALYVGGGEDSVRRYPRMYGLHVDSAM